MSHHPCQSNASNSTGMPRQSQRPRVRPAADIVERSDGFYLYLDMPGVAHEDLTLDIEGDELSIQAVTRFGNDSSVRVHALEFGDVEYHAQFTLSDLVDVARIGAQLANGVLTIFMPKREAAQPKRVRIEVR